MAGRVPDQSTQAGRTRLRLLAAASEEFAQRGFANARVRHIVDQAQVNLAAINYHFGGKDGLYRATLAHLVSHVGAAQPGVNRRGRSPEQRLRRRIHGMLDRFLLKPSGSSLGRILAHEAMNPTSHVDDVVAEALRPELEVVAALLAEVAPPGTPMEDIRMAAIGVLGQCLLYQFAHPALRRAFPGVPDGRALCRDASEHIARMTVAGLRGGTSQRDFSCKADSDTM